MSDNTSEGNDEESEGDKQELDETSKQYIRCTQQIKDIKVLRQRYILKIHVGH